MPDKYQMATFEALAVFYDTWMEILNLRVSISWLILALG